MISLPGLPLTLGRFDIAAGILRTYARFVDRGMLPNRFPDGGTAPEYNTADATLWLFQALDDYFAQSRDPELTRELFPAAEVRSFVLTRKAHATESASILPTACCAPASAGSQLTWMDAKHGDQVFTPRMGKPRGDQRALAQCPASGRATGRPRRRRR